MKLPRLYDDGVTVRGHFTTDENAVVCCAIENSAHQMTPGTWRYRRYASPHFHDDAGNALTVWRAHLDPAGRDVWARGLEIHPANEAKQLEGCIAPAMDLVVGADGQAFGESSRTALAKFMQATADVTELALTILAPETTIVAQADGASA